MRSDYFKYDYIASGLADVGKKRTENQDEIIMSPRKGIFGVSDGMGGLSDGGTASAFVSKSFPLVVDSFLAKLSDESPAEVADMLQNSVQMISDRLYQQGNSDGIFRYGATLSGVMLYQDKAIFICIGDSRGYVLPKFKKYPIQITDDMNVAGYLVRQGEMTKEEAKYDYRSSRLMAFIGMPEPATPETFVVDIRPGDRILLCSDGLYGMVDDRDLAKLMRSDKDSDKVCQNLIDQANENGGKDNISALYIKII